MQIKVESVSNVEKKLFIQIPEEAVTQEINKAYRVANQQARIPGFRSGKIPRALLEKRYGASIEDQVFQDLVKNSVSHALIEKKLKAVRVTEISDTDRQEGKGFSYTASIEVRPDIEPKDYLGVSIEAAKHSVSEKDIDDVITRLRESQAILKPIEGATQVSVGDFAGIHVKIPGKEGTDQSYQVGQENGQKALDEALLTMKVGDTKAVTLSVGKEGEEPKSLEIELELKSIKQKIVPELDDAFAKSVGPFETLADLRTHISKDLEADVLQKSKQENIKKILAVVLEKNPLELPKSLIEGEIDFLRRRVEDQMLESGLKTYPADFSKEKLESELLPQATTRVHEQLLIEAIAEKENIGVSNEERDQQIALSARQARIPTAELRAYYEKTNRLGSLDFQILAEKTLDFLLSKANIT